MGSAAAMNELMTTLRKIQEQTGAASAVMKRTKTEELNEFDRQRAKVAEGVRLVRKTLKERDDLLGLGKSSKLTIELSNAARLQLKAVRADVEGERGGKGRPLSDLILKNWVVFRSSMPRKRKRRVAV